MKQTMTLGEILIFTHWPYIFFKNILSNPLLKMIFFQARIFWGIVRQIGESK